MQEYKTVEEAAQILDVDKSTIYRRVKAGTLSEKRINGIKHVLLEVEKGDLQRFAIPCESLHYKKLLEEKEALRKTLEKQVEDLKERLLDANDARERSDTIILQLTRQIEKQTLMLEDMRDQSFWKRIKATFGFATSS